MFFTRIHSSALSFILFSILFFLNSANAQNSGSSNYTAPDTISLNGNKLVKKDERSDAQVFVASYVPANETLENWTKLFAVSFYKGQNYSPYNAVIQASRNVIDEKRKGDTIANYKRIEDPKKGWYGIDFFISGNYKGKPTAYEHNVFRYVKIPGGMISYQSARRIYLTDTNNKEVDKFIDEIPTVGPQIWNELLRTDLPKP